MNEALAVEPYVVGPGKPPLEFRLTSERVKKFWEIRRERKANPPPFKKGEKADFETPIEREAREIFRTLKKMRAQIDEMPNCKDKSDLSAAYSRLLAAWQLFSQTPGPGQRKPSKDRLKPILDVDPFSPQTPQAVVYKPIFTTSNIPI